MRCKLNKIYEGMKYTHIRRNVVFLALVVLVKFPDSKEINLGGNICSMKNVYLDADN